MRYGMSVRTLARIAERDPKFPRATRLNCRVVLFERDALDAYFKSKRSTPCAPTKEAFHAGD